MDSVFVTIWGSTRKWTPILRNACRKHTETPASGRHENLRPVHDASNLPHHQPTIPTSNRVNTLTAKHVTREGWLLGGNDAFVLFCPREGMLHRFTWWAGTRGTPSEPPTAAFPLMTVQKYRAHLLQCVSQASARRCVPLLHTGARFLRTLKH